MNKFKSKYTKITLIVTTIFLIFFVFLYNYLGAYLVKYNNDTCFWLATRLPFCLVQKGLFRGNFFRTNRVLIFRNRDGSLNKFLLNKIGNIKEPSQERVIAIGVFGETVKDEELLAKTLFNLLDDPFGDVRKKAVIEVRENNVKTEGILKKLMAMYTTPQDMIFRDEIVTALSVVGRDNPEIIGFLVKLLEKEGNHSVLESIILSMENIDKKYRGSVIPAILKKLNHEYKSIRRLAAMVLGEIGSKTVLTELRNALEREEKRKRENTSVNVGADDFQWVIDEIEKAINKIDQREKKESKRNNRGHKEQQGTLVN